MEAVEILRQVSEKMIGNISEPNEKNLELSMTESELERYQYWVMCNPHYHIFPIKNPISGLMDSYERVPQLSLKDAIRLSKLNDNSINK